MAKVEYSALINRIKGRVSHSVVSNWKGRGIIKRHNGSPRQANTVTQQEIRGLMNQLAGEFHALDTMNKFIWQSYASSLSPAITALNAFIGINMVIQRYFPGTARKEVPPLAPTTPEAIISIAATAMAGGNFCLTWTNPTDAAQIIVADYAISPGKRTDANPKWTFGASCGADAGELLVSAGVPVGLYVYLRARTVLVDGKSSPWSAYRTATAIT